MVADVLVVGKDGWRDGRREREGGGVLILSVMFCGLVVLKVDTCIGGTHRYIHI